jgi:ferrochelatase
MARFIGFDPAAPGSGPETALLLVNLGTPAAPTTDAVGEYLAEFLSDRRVIEAPRAIWWPILHGYILRTRPRRSAEAYAKVWRDDGSPLLVFSEQLATALGALVARRTGGKVATALAMTYGAPSALEVVTQLARDGVRQLLVLPLFPQYSATSSGAALDAVLRAVQKLRAPPALRTINDYHADAGYIAALARSVQTHWARNGRGEKLLLSFHGIPQRYAEAGDPYPERCQETASLLAQALTIPDDDLLVTFQSRLGRQPWLRPYTDTMVEQLARQNVASLDVLCPGFAVDCLETLEEVALRYRATFLTSGGAQFRYIPALNADNGHVLALADLALRNVAGWV